MAYQESTQSLGRQALNALTPKVGSEITEGQARIDAAIPLVADAITRLENRLSLVTAPQGPDSNTVPTMGRQTQLGVMLHGNADALEMLVSRIDRLTESVGL